MRPTVRKTFFKGLIAVAAFSAVLDVTSSNLAGYALYLLVTVAAVLLYMFEKRSSRYEISEDALSIKAPLRARKLIRYSEIADMSLSQGPLAKRFNCGTVFIFLRSGQGRYISLGGGAAEALRDVADPKRIYYMIAARLNPL